MVDGSLMRSSITYHNREYLLVLGGRFFLSSTKGLSASVVSFILTLYANTAENTNPAFVMLARLKKKVFFFNKKTKQIASKPWELPQDKFKPARATDTTDP